MITALSFAILTQTSVAPLPPVKDFYSTVVADIDGKSYAFKQLKGKVVILVNTASFCGLTPQYGSLQALYQEHEKQGLVILGFPANNFRNQEPHSNQEIKEMCKRDYKVTFPMMSKISVKGEDIHPLYKWLIAQSDRPKDEIEWNFSKFLIDRQGKVRYRVLPKVDPSQPEFKKLVVELLNDGSTDSVDPSRL
ncbi:MAG: glutathione peroxidase [Chthonomonas sp.]|nr:glutathione peroxidase [Chthonomonas sp.]